MHSSRWRKFKYAIKEPKKKTSPTHMTRLWCRTWRVWEAAVFARLKNKFGWSQTKTKKQLSKSKIKMKKAFSYLFCCCLLFAFFVARPQTSSSVLSSIYTHVYSFAKTYFSLPLSLSLLLPLLTCGRHLW